MFQALQDALSTFFSYIPQFIGNTSDILNSIKMTAKERHGIRFAKENFGEHDLVEVANKLKQLTTDVYIFTWKLIDEGKAIDNPTEKM